MRIINYYGVREMRFTEPQCVYVNPSSDYVYAGSFVSSGWFRSTGNTGWYSETYGGGWYMTDSTWIRNYNSKQVYIDSLLEIGSGGIQNAGNWRILNSAGSGWANIIERNSGSPIILWFCLLRFRQYRILFKSGKYFKLGNC